MKTIYIKPESTKISVANNLLTVIVTSSGEGIPPGEARSIRDGYFDDNFTEDASDGGAGGW